MTRTKEIASLANYAASHEENKPEWNTSREHDTLAGLVQMAAQTKNARLIVTLPPRCGATTLMGTLLPAFLLNQDPALHISYSAYNEKLGVRALRHTAKLVPGAFMGTAQHYLQTQAGGCYWNLPAGLHPCGYGMDVALIDGPIFSRQEAENPVHMKALTQWYLDALLTRVLPGGAIIVLAQRWNNQDFVSSVLRTKGDYEPFVSVNLPAVDALGESLWPSLFSTADFKRIKYQVGEIDWHALYLGCPLPGDRCTCRCARCKKEQA